MVAEERTIANERSLSEMIPKLAVVASLQAGSLTISANSQVQVGKCVALTEAFPYLTSSSVDFFCNV